MCVRFDVVAIRVQCRVEREEFVDGDRIVIRELRTYIIVDYGRSFGRVSAVHISYRSKSAGEQPEGD
jgi:hypothetical protein